MATINPVPRDNAAPEVADIFEKVTKAQGFMPNFFGLMAHRPEVLKTFIPLYTAVVNKGVVEPRYKELAYLKVASVNGCQY